MGNTPCEADLNIFHAFHSRNSLLHTGLAMIAAHAIDLIITLDRCFRSCFCAMTVRALRLVMHISAVMRMPEHTDESIGKEQSEQRYP